MNTSEQKRNNLSNPPELLCPAGDFARLKTAVAFGADAVYLAAREFGMRTASANFSEDELEEAVKFAHQSGVKVYLTCNTLPRNDEIDRLPALIKKAEDCGVDAAIVTDLGALRIIQNCAPSLELHISVQTGVVNYQSALFYHELGAKRVVLARELSLEEIAEIRQKTPPTLELEAFVHGAVCVSVSGRCLLSNYLTGRDANRGDCAQPCRWRYSLVEEKRPGQYFDITEDERGTHLLNAKDLCMLPHLDRLHQAGVTSFKIEGRAKSSYYVAVTAAAYRAAIDLYQNDPAAYVPPAYLMEELNKISHREYSTGFYFSPPQQGQTYATGGYVRDYQVVGVVVGNRDGRVIVSQRNRFFAGETLDCLPPRELPFLLSVREMFDENNTPITVAPHSQMTVQIPSDCPVKPGTLLRRKETETN